MSMDDLMPASEEAMKDVPKAFELGKQYQVTTGRYSSDKPYPDNNPKTTLGVAKAPLHLVPPVALAYASQAFKDGAGKYGPYNWREKQISSSVYYAAALRHLTAWWDGEDIAEDSGVHHLAHAMACLMMVLDGKEIGMLNDDRPLAGGTAKVLEDFKES